jgi:hypothetical protein
LLCDLGAAVVKHPASPFGRNQKAREKMLCSPL